MSSKIKFYPVDNGDMTLIKINDNRKTTILVDMNIRETSSDDKSEHYDVLLDLKKHLRNEKGVLHLDVLLQTHPDVDHLRGITKHFHLGRPEDHKKESGKIIIDEIWSSPIVFSRYKEEFCDEAVEFLKEVKRRVRLFKTNKPAIAGNRVRVIGEYDDNKRKGIEAITSNTGENFNIVNDELSEMIKMNVLAPLPKGSDENEEKLSKNRSSIIIQFEISGQNGASRNNLFLSAGDAEVEIWEQLWDKHQGDFSKLKYNILLAPHHCSWRSLSHDSESENDSPKISDKAINALSQAEKKATIIASSKEIKIDKDTPPSHLAKKEYEKIASNVNGKFRCLATDSKKVPPEPIVINLTVQGTQDGDATSSKSNLSAGLVASAAPRRHG